MAQSWETLTGRIVTVTIIGVVREDAETLTGQLVKREEYITGVGRHVRVTLELDIEAD